jgi:hypothetical protein
MGNAGGKIEGKTGGKIEGKTGGEPRRRVRSVVPAAAALDVPAREPIISGA